MDNREAVERDSEVPDVIETRHTSRAWMMTQFVVMHLCFAVLCLLGLNFLGRFRLPIADSLDFWLRAAVVLCVIGVLHLAIIRALRLKLSFTGPIAVAPFMVVVMLVRTHHDYEFANLVQLPWAAAIATFLGGLVSLIGIGLKQAT